MPSEMHLHMARDQYRKVSAQALMADFLGALMGENTDLWSYDEVAKSVNARQQIERGTRMVPLEKIVGSVGRYRDFTRTFLPRSGVDVERWTRVYAAMNDLAGLPPVELFKIGDVYFVRDGNHRVSVALADGQTSIEAYVTEVQTDVPLTLDDFERDQWLIKAEHAQFLDKTKLDELRPDHGIRLTEPGRYKFICEHIEAHRYFRNLDLERAGQPERLEWEDAVMSWYDAIYLPVVEAIRRYNLMEQFPSRTEADLYLWIGYHRERLAQQYSLAPLSPEAAVSTFAETHSDGTLEKTMKSLRLALHRTFGDDERPLGMSEEELVDSRARHAAGEISILESEQRREEEESLEQALAGESALEDG